MDSNETIDDVTQARERIDAHLRARGEVARG